MSTRPDIFLSYNREDAATARRFAEAFEREGFKVWWDATLRSGEAYDEVTEKALREAKAVVVLWSKKSVASRWVRAEATLADRNKTLVPAMIEPCERPIMFELTQTAELGHWQGAPDDKVWLIFLSDVKRFVEKDPVPAQPTLIAESAMSLPGTKPGERGDAPSLAVLPFTNRSGLAEDDVFAIGMVDDVIEALSQGVNLHVIASSATARFRTGAIPDLDAMAKHLGVRYLLEGNVRRVGTVLRVTSQLVEASSGAILWTQRFERPLSELAALQEDLVVEVAANLDAQVYRNEIERVLKKPADLTAWEAVTRAIASYRQFNGESILRAVEEAKRALAIAPDYGLAHASLALAESVIFWALMPDNNPDQVRRIKDRADRALTLDPNNAPVLANAALALTFIGHAEAALHLAERAVRLSPSSGLACFVLGTTYCLLNRCDEALVQFDADLRLSPGSHLNYNTHAWQAASHIRAERWHDAMRSLEITLALYPNFSWGLAHKGTLCHRDGRVDEAREAMVRVREIEPETPLALWELRWSRVFNRAPNREEILRHLRMAWAATELAA